MSERIFTLLVNMNCGSHQVFTKVYLTEEETKALYRFTCGLDESATVDVDRITTEQFYVMEEKLGGQLLTLLTESSYILDFVASIHTVILCRLHRIFCGL